jgi:hypothetical protein
MIRPAKSLNDDVSIAPLRQIGRSRRAGVPERR